MLSMKQAAFCSTQHEWTKPFPVAKFFWRHMLMKNTRVKGTDSPPAAFPV
jgi:hypothetical protein